MGRVSLLLGLVLVKGQKLTLRLVLILVLIGMKHTYFIFFQLEKMNEELDRVQECVRTKENEKDQIQRNLLAESRQLAALRGEMEQLRDRFKSQEDNHVAAVADLQKAHHDRVNALEAELKNVQRGAPSGAEDTLSSSQRIAFQQVSVPLLARCFNFYS